MTADTTTAPGSDPDELMSAGDAARLVGVDPVTLRRAHAAGRLPATRTPGGHNRYRRGDVLAVMARPRRGAW